MSKSIVRVCAIVGAVMIITKIVKNAGASVKHVVVVDTLAC